MPGQRDFPVVCLKHGFLLRTGHNIVETTTPLRPDFHIGDEPVTLPRIRGLYEVSFCSDCPPPFSP